jgi:hypothetical protein
MLKVKRYLGNISTKELHDTADERTGCELGRIHPSKRRWYDSASDARLDFPYADCRWCIGSEVRFDMGLGASDTIPP